MTASVTDRQTCRLCQSKKLILALELAPTPLGDDFVPADRLGVVQTLYRHDLMLCGDCGNVQLRQVVNPEIIYRKYKYTTSVSLGLSDHFRRYADDLVRKINPPAGALVVEIGSNEGAMLRAIKERGFKSLGVDPATDIARRATESGVETLPTYFTRELALKLREERGPAGVVLGNYVLANIDDFSDMIDGVGALLAPDGVLILETSYCLDVVEKDLLDTIFHEHLSYFAVAPLVKFFPRHKMQLIDVERVPTKGGSIRLTIQLEGGPRPVSPAVGEYMRREHDAGIDRPEAYAALGRRLDARGGQLRNMLAPLKAAGKSIAAYGAAVGLTTMIYQFKLGDFISYILDDNQDKQHLFSPGLHLPVVPSGELYVRKPDYVVVLAWRYIEQIMKKHTAYLQQSGKFLIPQPEIKLISA